MISKEVVLENSDFDSRKAAALIQKASIYKSLIWIERDERKANAKSLLGLLSLGISNGMRVVIRADGEDEESAVTELEGCFNSYLGEAE